MKPVPAIPAIASQQPNPQTGATAKTAVPAIALIANAVKTPAAASLQHAAS